jgi:hypothetical protein
MVALLSHLGCAWMQQLCHACLILMASLVRNLGCTHTVGHTHKLCCIGDVPQCLLLLSCVPTRVKLGPTVCSHVLFRVNGSLRQESGKTSRTHM